MNADTQLQARVKSEADAQPEANTQPETNAQPTDAAASPRPEPNTAPADNQPRSGAQTVREILNTKINPFVSAGLREIFRDPANMYVRPPHTPAPSTPPVGLCLGTIGAAVGADVDTALAPRTPFGSWASSYWRSIGK